MKIIFIILTSLSLEYSVLAQTKNKESFSVIAFGDMPYFLPEDYSRFENLIKAVNEEHQAFNVHVGDIKSSNTPCSEESYQKIYNYFQQFSKPLIYTPGDNEWTDCTKTAAGSYDPEERLAVIRKMFFKDKSSFGKEKLLLTDQSQNPAFSKYIENKRWTYNTIAFATLHLVGTNNNFVPESKNHNSEYYERMEANLAWLKEIFAEAKRNNNPCLVIFTQADMFNSVKESSGFTAILKELKNLTLDFNKPVLLVIGDSHKYLVDKPFVKDDKMKHVVENFTRLQVFGENDMHAVKITFHPESSSPYQIEEFLIKGN